MTYAVHNIHCQAQRTTQDGRIALRELDPDLALAEPLFVRDSFNEAESERLARLELFRQAQKKR